MKRLSFVFSPYSLIREKRKKKRGKKKKGEKEREGGKSDRTPTLFFCLSFSEGEKEKKERKKERGRRKGGSEGDLPCCLAFSSRKGREKKKKKRKKAGCHSVPCVGKKKKGKRGGKRGGMRPPLFLATEGEGRGKKRRGEEGDNGSRRSLALDPAEGRKEGRRGPRVASFRKKKYRRDAADSLPPT